MSAIDDLSNNANPACGHKEVRRSTGHIMVTNGIDQGAWLQKKLENLSAAPDELDHACREA